MKEPDYCVVLITVPSEQEGEVIGRTLVEEKLAACVNRVVGVQSVFLWQGRVDSAAECLLMCKTKTAVFPRLKERVNDLHSYDVPEMVALPIWDMNKEYEKWLAESVQP